MKLFLDKDMTAQIGGLIVARRPVFIAEPGIGVAYKTIMVDFPWFGGFARVQKEKCVKSLHDAYRGEHRGQKVLEISNYSSESLGVALSAFNLAIRNGKGKNFTVECIFQSSKIFADGGPYKDLLYCSSKEAKKDIHLKTSGQLKSFALNNQLFPLEPKTFFYNWVYINTLVKNERLALEILDYDAFTDIAFNPNASCNCQAAAVAAYVSLFKSQKLSQALASPESFLQIVYGGKMCQEQSLFS